MEVQMKYGALEKSDTMVPFGSIGYVNMLHVWSVHAHYLPATEWDPDEVDLIRPAITWMREVFPEPLGPRMHNISPAFTLPDTFFKMDLFSVVLVSLLYIETE